jgi:hypothetical protein
VICKKNIEKIGCLQLTEKNSIKIMQISCVKWGRMDLNDELGNIGGREENVGEDFKR